MFIGFYVCIYDYKNIEKVVLLCMYDSICVYIVVIVNDLHKGYKKNLYVKWAVEKSVVSVEIFPSFAGAVVCVPRDNF